MILVFQKKPDEAVPLLEEAAAMPRADPRYHFHLAVAYDRAGEAGEGPCRPLGRPQRQSHRLRADAVGPADVGGVGEEIRLT